MNKKINLIIDLNRPLLKEGPDFLSHKVIMKNQKEACDQCCSCLNQFENTNVIQQSNKYIFKSCADKTQPFGYQQSDLKNLYTSAKSLQSRLSAPIMTQSQMLNLPNYN